MDKYKRLNGPIVNEENIEKESIEVEKIRRIIMSS